jgi:hypothetical protein
MSGFSQIDMSAALVHLEIEGDNARTQISHAVRRLQRTEFGRPADNIRFKTGTPMAASVC